MIKKSDEFYTQFSDIESELKHYKEHFKNKVVFCNCDDPRNSNFFNYFVSNFKELGLRKLIAACYRKQEIDLFNTEVIAQCKKNQTHNRVKKSNALEFFQNKQCFV